jgi:hypothetical protein
LNDRERGRARPKGRSPVVAALLSILAVGCGSSITSPPETLSLLDPLQPRSQDSAVTISSAGVSPQVLHLNTPVTVRFTNGDRAAHKLEPAPELQYGDCPEMSQLGTLPPGETGSVTLSRSGIICAYHDSAGPSDPNFQGLIVLH